MPPLNLNIDKLVQDIADAVTGVVREDFRLLRGYSEASAREIAEYAAIVAEGAAAGDLTEEQVASEMKELDHMVARYLRNVEAIRNVGIERVVEAVSGTIYGAISAAAASAGVHLPNIIATPRG